MPALNAPRLLTPAKGEPPRHDACVTLIETPCPPIGGRCELLACAPSSLAHDLPRRLSAPLSSGKSRCNPQPQTKPRRRYDRMMHGRTAVQSPPCSIPLDVPCIRSGHGLILAGRPPVHHDASLRKFAAQHVCSVCTACAHVLIPSHHVQHLPGAWRACVARCTRVCGARHMLVQLRSRSSMMMSRWQQARVKMCA